MINDYPSYCCTSAFERIKYAKVIDEHNAALIMKDDDPKSDGYRKLMVLYVDKDDGSAIESIDDLTEEQALNIIAGKQCQTI